MEPGSGAWRFSFPSGYEPAASNVFVAWIQDASAGIFLAAGISSTSSNTLTFIGHRAGTSFVGAGVPMIWAAGDQLLIDGVFEVAAA